MVPPSSPCAACKLLRRKCTPECVFAPHFPADQPARFANVHRVFGASNVAKLLRQIAPEQREDAAVSLAYEAEARLRDPVHGCVGYICLLQRKLREVQHDLADAKKELAAYTGPPAAFGQHFLPQAQQLVLDTGMPAAAPSAMRQHQHQEMQYHNVALHPMAAGEQEALSNYSSQQEEYDRLASLVSAQLFSSSTAPFVIEQYFEQEQAESRSDGGGLHHSSSSKQNDDSTIH